MFKRIFVIFGLLAFLGATTGCGSSTAQVKKDDEAQKSPPSDKDKAPQPHDDQLQGC